jgi:GNAT superfamily N-acetyltransferase
VRAAAASSRPLAVRLGPVDTFAPVNPVAYLRVGGPGIRDALDDLRGRCNSGPLSRTSDHEFVPHVTVADELAPERLAAAQAALSSYGADASISRVHVLAELPGRIWRPIADAPLGDPVAVVGRGSLPLEVTTSGSPDAAAAALLAISNDAPGLPFAVTARRDGAVVAAAWGWSAGEVLEIADLVVTPEQRGQGIGRHLLAGVEDLARRRGVTCLGATGPTEGAAAALFVASGYQSQPSGGAGRRRWERQLQQLDEDRG